MIKDSSISQNFKLHSDKMTIEYFITNMRPISVRTSLRYLVQLILKEVFEIPVLRSSTVLNLQRNSYYGARNAASERIRLSEKEVSDLLDNQYHFSDLRSEDYDRKMMKSSNEDIIDLVKTILKDRMKLSNAYTEAVLKIESEE